MAAPTKLTPDVQERLLGAIASGNYYETACALAGIHYGTMRQWLIDGKQARSGPKREFYEAVTRAEAEAESRVVAMWQAKMPEDWQAARDFLARRHADRWGPKDKHQITGVDDGPVAIRHITVIPPLESHGHVDLPEDTEG